MKGLAIFITILLVVYQASSAPIDEAHGRETRAAFNGDFISSTCIGPYCQYSNGPSIITFQCSGGNCERWVCAGGVCKEELRRVFDVHNTNIVHKRSVGDYCPNCGIPSYPQLRSPCPGGNCARSACPGGNCARSACPGGNCARSACPGGICARSACPGGSRRCFIASKGFLDFNITNIQKRSADRQDNMDNITHTTP